MDSDDREPASAPPGEPASTQPNEPVSAQPDEPVSAPFGPAGRAQPNEPARALPGDDVPSPSPQPSPAQRARSPASPDTLPPGKPATRARARSAERDAARKARLAARREEMLREVRRVAAGRGVGSLSRGDFTAVSGIPASRIYRCFKNWTELCRLAGIEPARAVRRISDDQIFAAMRDAFLEAGEIPPAVRFRAFFRHSAAVLHNRGLTWPVALTAFRAWAEINDPGFPYMGALPGPGLEPGSESRTEPRSESGAEPRPESRTGPDLESATGPRSESGTETGSAGSTGDGVGGAGQPRDGRSGGSGKGGPRALRADSTRALRGDSTSAPRGANPGGRIWPSLSPGTPGDKTTLGELIHFRGMTHAPVNEQGVVLLFGAVARDLGYAVEAVRTAYPDCLAKRRVSGGRWQRVRVEFEYRSRSFRDHGHDPEGCDVVVCWTHDWPGCPLEVLELKSAIAGLAGA